MKSDKEPLRLQLKRSLRITDLYEDVQKQVAD